MGHKTRLHFPQAEKKTLPPPLTFPVKAQDLCGTFVSLKSVCESVCVISAKTHNLQASVTSHWDIFR